MDAKAAAADQAEKGQVAGQLAPAGQRHCMTVSLILDH